MSNWRTSHDERIAEELKYEICTAMSSRGFVAGKDFEHWYQLMSPPREYQENRWDFSVALLVMSLPNICVINNYQRGRVVKRIQTIARLKAQHSLFRPTLPHIDISQVLNKVHEININTFKAKEDPHFALELCFLSPAKVIRVNGLYLSPRSISKAYEGPILNPGAEDVEFLRSYIRDDQLERVFRGVNGLKRLKYHHHCPKSDLRYLHQHVWRPTKLISALILNARHSCTHLDLTTKDGYWLPITCGFRELEVLRDLRLDSYLLDCRPPPSGTLEALQRLGVTHHEVNNFSTVLPRMVDILPASIEKIALHGYIDFEQMARLLNGLIAMKNKVLPLLAKINLESFYTEKLQPYPSKSTKQRLEEVGIVIERNILGLSNLRKW